ncbi:MAG: DUF2848 domain-containing protein [Proteobacteria bacterium]|nr:DUF2848 domain-containing protein [Pseudomonadota bacterium]
MDYGKLTLMVDSVTGKQELAFPIRRLICAGWVGRNEKALQVHIDELAEHGVPGPTKTPIYMNFSPYLITTSDAINVINSESSGEVEYVLLKEGDRMYIGVGSDHTDRGFEKFSIPASKQLCAKVMAPVVWLYQEIKDDWDQIIIRSWTTSGGKRMLYQEDVLASILDVEALLERLPKDEELPSDGLVLFSGTIPTKIGVVFGERFDFEMEDSVLDRKIRHGYQVRVLPQHL